MQFKNSLHATTWWLLGIFIATAASLSNSGYFLVGICATCLITIKLFRDSTMRSRSLVFYGWLALSVVVIRLLFRVVFNQPDFLAETALNLPQLSFSLVGMQVDLFGPVSFRALQFGLTDGLRLAAIILAIGMANTIANPRKLLRSTPTALYEVATAAAVAINLAPQLIESMHRVKRARELRSSATGLRQFSSLVVPVLEGALDSSLELAASMDARGFGLTQATSPRRFQLSKFLVLSGVVFAGVSAFALVAIPNLEIFAVSGLVLAFLLLVISFRYSARARVRTFYRIEAPAAKDYAVLILAVLLGLLVFKLAGRL